MFETQQNSFKRIYRDDGTYHYQTLAKNHLCKKGKEYLENWEITGNNEMNKTTRNFVPTDWIRNDFLPKLVDLAQLLQKKYNKTIHICRQWDNMSQHVKTVLLRLIVDLFGKVGWEWITQLANIPLSKVWTLSYSRC